MKFEICLNCFKFKGDFEVCPHCGYAEDTPPEQAYHLNAGVLLDNRYVIGTVIGFGGFGVIYHAWDLQLAKLLAIKEFFPSGMVNRVPGTKEVIVFSGDEESNYHASLLRFLEEARNIARFSTNPNIINVLNYFEENNTAYIVMEYLEGHSLRDYLEKRGGILSAEEALDIIAPIIDGLETIHKEGIVHRDIHPGNIYITSNNDVKIIDFGSAKLSSAEKEKTLTVVVTQGYAAPEQYRSKSRQGSYTDIYALGATLYKMVTGVLPDEAPDRQVEETLVLPSELGIEIGSNQERAIFRAMSIDPDLRFQNVDEFKAALFGDKPVDLPAEALRKRRIRRGILGGAVSLVVIAGIVSAALFTTILKPKYTFESITIEADSITLMVPLQGLEESHQAQKASWDGIIKTFMDENPGISVELTTVLAAEYQERLADSTNTTTLFSAGLAGSEQLGQLADLEILINSLDAGQILFLDEYLKCYPQHNRMPLGFNFAVAYGSEPAFKSAADEVPAGIASFKELNGYSYAVDADGLAPLLATYCPDLPNQKVIKPGESSTATILKIAEADQQTAADTPIKLLKNKTELLVAAAADLPVIQEELPGYYRVIPLKDGEQIAASFADEWAVSANASENQQRAAMLFLSFLLNTYSQNQLHIQQDDALPLNREVYADYLQYKSSELAFIRDNESHLLFYTRDNQIYVQFATELYKNVLQNGASQAEAEEFLAKVG